MMEMIVCRGWSPFLFWGDIPRPEGRGFYRSPAGAGPLRGNEYHAKGQVRGPALSCWWL